jgi:hypothetical protein
MGAFVSAVLARAREGVERREIGRSRLFSSVRRARSSVGRSRGCVVKRAWSRELFLAKASDAASSF